MKKLAEKALLPPGMSDGLPPDVDLETHMRERLMHVFSGWGYRQVKPPLMEFEESLLGGNGTDLSRQTFRLMDPVSGQMMGLRPDMTPQIGRIATTRLQKNTYPLRLSYAGDVLRVTGTQLQPERQLTEVGAEIIGSSSLTADCEVIHMAIEALEKITLKGLCIDLGLPALIPAICQDLTVYTPLSKELQHALDGKNAAEVTRLSARIEQETGKPISPITSQLLASVGPMEQAVEILSGLTLGQKANTKRNQLCEIATKIREQSPQTPVTIDAVDRRGFEYHDGVTFTFFARGTQREIGRGGRYTVFTPDGDLAIPATGITLFINTLLKVIELKPPRKTILLPARTSLNEGKTLREQGWVTIQELEPETSQQAHVDKSDCTHVLTSDGPQKL